MGQGKKREGETERREKIKEEEREEGERKREEEEGRRRAAGDGGRGDRRTRVVGVRKGGGKRREWSSRADVRANGVRECAEA
jgi:hypothetical protein